MCDPVYPVYVDSNVMAGRTGAYDPAREAFDDVIYMPCTAENGFVPELPKEVPDLIYLCFPNNPTGAVITKAELQKWVDYANKNDSIILYDAAYEAYISEGDVPHSIYECEGAKDCAIEFRSFSKTAGFTGLRLGFTVIPKDLTTGGRSSGRCGREGTERSTTERLTLCRRPEKPFIRPKEGSRCVSRSLTIWAMPRSSLTD